MHIFEFYYSFNLINIFIIIIFFFFMLDILMSILGYYFHLLIFNLNFYDLIPISNLSYHFINNPATLILIDHNLIVKKLNFFIY
jgi:hypothetical protein